MKNHNNTANSFKKITIGGALEETARKFPFNQAVKYAYIPSGKFAMTYYELNNYADKIAKGLMGIGLLKGDKIVVWATNYPEYLVLMFAAAKVGVILVPVNPQFKSAELGHVIENSGAKVVFFCDGQEKSDAIKIIAPTTNMPQPDKKLSHCLPSNFSFVPRKKNKTIDIRICNQSIASAHNGVLNLRKGTTFE